MYKGIRSTHVHRDTIQLSCQHLTDDNTSIIVTIHFIESTNFTSRMWWPLENPYTECNGHNVEVEAAFAVESDSLPCPIMDVEEDSHMSDFWHSWRSTWPSSGSALRNGGSNRVSLAGSENDIATQLNSSRLLFYDTIPPPSCAIPRCVGTCRLSSWPVYVRLYTAPITLYCLPDFA